MELNLRWLLVEFNLTNSSKLGHFVWEVTVHWGITWRQKSKFKKKKKEKKIKKLHCIIHNNLLEKELFFKWRNVFSAYSWQDCWGPSWSCVDHPECSWRALWGTGGEWSCVWSPVTRRDFWHSCRRTHVVQVRLSSWVGMRLRCSPSLEEELSAKKTRTLRLHLITEGQIFREFWWYLWLVGNRQGRAIRTPVSSPFLLPRELSQWASGFVAH